MTYLKFVKEIIRQLNSYFIAECEEYIDDKSYTIQYIIKSSNRKEGRDEICKFISTFKNIEFYSIISLSDYYQTKKSCDDDIYNDIQLLHEVGKLPTEYNQFFQYSKIKI
jgi:hypothetical protein